MYMFIIIGVMSYSDFEHKSGYGVYVHVVLVSELMLLMCFLWKNIVVYNSQARRSETLRMACRTHSTAKVTTPIRRSLLSVCDKNTSSVIQRNDTTIKRPPTSDPTLVLNNWTVHLYDNINNNKLKFLEEDDLITKCVASPFLYWIMKTQRQ